MHLVKGEREVQDVGIAWWWVWCVRFVMCEAHGMMCEVRDVWGSWWCDVRFVMVWCVRFVMVWCEVRDGVMCEVCDGVMCEVHDWCNHSSTECYIYYTYLCSLYEVGNDWGLVFFRRFLDDLLLHQHAQLDQGNRPQSLSTGAVSKTMADSHSQTCGVLAWCGVTAHICLVGWALRAKKDLVCMIRVMVCMIRVIRKSGDVVIRSFVIRWWSCDSGYDDQVIFDQVMIIWWWIWWSGHLWSGDDHMIVDMMIRSFVIRWWSYEVILVVASCGSPMVGPSLLVHIIFICHYIGMSLYWYVIWTQRCFQHRSHVLGE